MEFEPVAIVLPYVPPALRPRVAALFALDRALGDVLRSASEPMLTQIRLTWWHDRLCALDEGEVAAAPVLRDLAHHVVPHGVPGSELAALLAGWEALIDEEGLSAEEVDTYAHGRGGALFAAAGRLLDVADPRIERAGEAWALADLALHLRDAGERAAIEAAARERHRGIGGGRWPRRARPLSALAVDAGLLLTTPPPSDRRRAGRLMLHMLSGR